MLSLALATVCWQSALGRRIISNQKKYLDLGTEQQCRMAEWEREDCGFYGVDQGGCQAKGCCWEASHSGAPWCFHAAQTDTGGEQCAIADSGKQECGWMGIKKHGCEHLGCCWAKSHTGAPWCFAKGEITTEGPKPTTQIPTQGPKPTVHPSTDPKKQPVVYQISTRPWLYALAQSGLPANCGNGRGTRYVCLRDVPDEEWLRIKNDHADMVWFMGMWELGPASLAEATALKEDMKQWYGVPDLQQEDIIGSPYAPVDYRVNPDIGTEADLVAVREKLRLLGMRLMVDFVPNHFARDSKLFREHPEAFVHRPHGDTSPDNWWLHQDGKTVAFGRGPYDGPWTDTLQINYFSPRAVELVAELIVSVAKRADGIRLDMAHLILNEVFERAWGPVMQKSGFSRPHREFWEMVISLVKSRYPDTIFMSEAYDYYFTSPPEQELLVNLGIDFSYNKIVLDKLEEHHLGHLKDYIRSQPQSKLSKMAHFVENHDEPRAALALGGQQQAFAGSVVASTIPGLRLFYFGQYDGLKNRLGVHLRRAMPEEPSPALHAQYTKLLGILAHPVFHEGTWTYIDIPGEGSGWRLAAWRWEYLGTKRLVVVNFSDAEGWGIVQVANAHGQGGSDEIELTDLLTDTKYTRSANELRWKGLTVGMAPWTAHIFEY